MVEETRSSVPPTAGAPSPNKDVEENKIIAAIGYLGFLFLIPLLLKKDSPFAQFHAKQGLILFALEVVVGFLGWIPFLGWFIIIPFGYIASLILLVLGIMNVFAGKAEPLPVIGKLADKIHIKL